MKEKKKSFILYTDQEKHISMLTDAQAGQLLKAIYSYASQQTAPELTDSCVKMAFSFISEQINRDTEKYAEICERRRIAGKKGGAPLGNTNASKSDKTTNCFSKQPNQPDNINDTATVNDTENVNVTVNESESENDNENDTELHSMSNGNSCADAPAHSSGKSDECFVPRDIKDINAYCSEISKPIDADAFINYYQSNGWKVGKNPMKDWKAAVRQWRKRDEESGKIFTQHVSLTPKQPSYDLSVIERQSLALYADT